MRISDVREFVNKLSEAIVDDYYASKEDKSMIDESRLSEYIARDPRIKVELFCIKENENGKKRIFGIFKPAGFWIVNCWREDGKYENSEKHSPLDLILPPREWSEVFKLYIGRNGVNYILLKGTFREVDGKTELVSLEVVKDSPYNLDGAYKNLSELK